jgi:hypothetical protein
MPVDSALFITKRPALESCLGKIASFLVGMIEPPVIRAVDR